jgi:RHS repeat-associated protein
MSGNGHSISYKYNDSGIRTQKTVDGVTTNYRLVGDKVTYEDNGTDKIYYSYDASGNLVSMNLNGVEYYYIRNAQGDITGLFDGTGNPVVSYVYDSWGKLISIDGSLKDSVGVKNPYKYRGYRYDSETELYYLNSRYYNPEFGRFINTDAIAATQGEILSANMFVYCENNPSTLKDPDGFRPIYAVDPSEETDEERGESFATMNAVSKKEPPPTGVGYVPPKKGKVEPTKAPNGQKGWPDADGNVWVPIPEGHPLAHGGEHWDVNYPNGGYDNVYPPDGHVRKGSGGRGKFSPPGKRIVSDTAAVGGTALLLYGTYRVVRMTPSLAPPLWWTIPANLVCP